MLVKIVLVVLLTLALVFECFSTISVPITIGLYISEYNGYRFGVFGWCKVDRSVCSPIRIGYSKDDILLFNEQEYLHLPNHAKYALSNLLLVHVLAFVCVTILWIFGMLTCCRCIKTSRRMLIIAVVWSMVTFMVTLLGFLIDILIFSSHVTWCTWLTLASAFFTVLSGTVLCVMRRNLTYDKFLESKAEKHGVYVPVCRLNDVEELEIPWCNTMNHQALTAPTPM
ncbi:hypothetical protein KDRO_C06400 [Kluyveromyces lactis]|nr:hypothetical protein KDRO_C06400 [Kluyveromyces lactis]